MLRYSIRDLLWVTLVVALGLGWWATNAKRIEAVGQANRLRATLSDAQILNNEMSERLSLLSVRLQSFQSERVVRPSHYVDWSALNEQPVEP